MSHYGIFLKLCERCVPLCFINVLMYWYMNMTVVCKWGNSVSFEFRVLSGVRQGGILSPSLFSLYVDELISILRKSHVGCHLIDLFVGCLFYADDLALLSPTRETMQLLLDLTVEYGKQYCISFSFKKTKTIVFGKGKDLGTTAPLNIYGQPIEIVKMWRYLGFYIKGGDQFGFSAQPDLESFRRSANCILNTMYKPSEEVMMHLLYTNCIPIVTYGSQVKEYGSRDKHDVTVAINDCIRKIFGFNRWKSVRELRQQMGYKGIEEIFALQKARFLRNSRESSNDVVRFMADFNPFTEE